MTPTKVTPTELAGLIIDALIDSSESQAATIKLSFKKGEGETNGPATQVGIDYGGRNWYTESLSGGRAEDATYNLRNIFRFFARALALQHEADQNQAQAEQRKEFIDGLKRCDEELARLGLTEAADKLARAQGEKWYLEAMNSPAAKELAEAQRADAAAKKRARANGESLTEEDIEKGEEFLEAMKLSDAADDA